METKNPNVNCLEGMKCPQCDSYGPFTIWIQAEATISDDGIMETREEEWGDDSKCFCPDCLHNGKVKNFKEVNQK